MLRDFLVPINRAGWPFVGGAFVLAVVLTLIWHPLWVPSTLLALFVLYFFRDPERVTPLGDDIAVAPGEGLVSKVDRAKPPAELDMGDEPRNRISIFLSVFDVHVNRNPAAGKVELIKYHKGKFLNASLDKASDENERNAVKLRLADGRDLAYVQIAGLVARRIICDLNEGDEVKAGARYGLIRFGSRMDIYLPLGAEPLVSPGQRMVGGETVIADLAPGAKRRHAEVN